MPSLLSTSFFYAATLFSADLTIDTNFPGGSARIESLDQAARKLVIRPSSHKDAGWECWWYFHLRGITPGEKLALTVRGMSFALPRQASYSLDGKTWQHTAVGKSEKGEVTYQLKFDQDHIWLAWGPPFQLSDAKQLISRALAANTGAKEFELARTKAGNHVPALRWEPSTSSNDSKAKKHGIWLQSRQHAWESGASWVGAGFVDWLSSNEAEAKALRANTRIVYVPIMDVDNVERGAGGKDQKPHDHNRDWSDEPVFAAVKAAQGEIAKMDEAGEFDLFIDLHNPGPSDAKPYFYVTPADLHSKERAAKQAEWLTSAREFLGKEKLGLDSKTRESGPGYHPLWRQISKNWVNQHSREHVVAVTLETTWNSPNSTQDGYRAYGRALGRSIQHYLQPP
jgi:hypothetical protein